MTEEYRDPLEDGDKGRREDGATFADPGEPGAEEQVTEANAGEEVQAAPVTQEALPPEARGELNGGPLGCCLGVAIGLMVSLSIAVIGRLYANDLLPILHSPLLVLILLRVAMGIAALAAGAVEIIVVDCHGAGGAYSFKSFLPGRLESGAQYVFGYPWARYIAPFEQGCDAILFVGAHAMAGTPDGVLCHTVSSEAWYNAWINDTLVGESGI